MALLEANFVFKNGKRELNGEKDSRLLIHSFLYPYNGDINSLRADTNTVPTVGSPTGYEFIKWSDISTTFPYNLLVPTTYPSVVIYSDPLPAIEAGELVIAENDDRTVSFYLAYSDIPFGTPISSGFDIRPVNNILVFPPEQEIILLRGSGLYDVRNNLFYNLSNRGYVNPAHIGFKFGDNERVYRDLPVNIYNLGEIEDRDIIILTSLEELKQNIEYFNLNQYFYIRNTGEYYYKQKDNNSSGYSIAYINPEENNYNQISPTRYLLKGFEAGLDYVDQTSSDFIYEQYFNPLTAAVENLPFLSQMLGADGIADKTILSDRILNVFATDEYNPLSESEIRTVLNNTLGWCRQPERETEPGTVKLYDTYSATKVDFIYASYISKNYNLLLAPGDKGLRLGDDPNIYTVSPGTTLTSVKVSEETTARDEIIVPDLTRLHGIIYDRPSDLNAKGIAMSGFKNSIPLVDNTGDIDYFRVRKDEYVQYGFDQINYQNWLDNPYEVELLSGYTYILYSRTEEELIPTIVELNAGFNSPGLLIGDIEIITPGRSIRFKLKDGLTYEKINKGMWKELGLKFSISKLKNYGENTITYRPEDWMGYIGSRGSKFGITVSNTIIGLEKKIPVVADDLCSITVVKDEHKREKALKLKDHCGVNHVQSEDLISDSFSYSGDYYLPSMESRYLELLDHEAKYYIDNTTGDLLEISSTSFTDSRLQLRINNQLSGRFFDAGDKLVKGKSRFYYFDSSTNILQAFINNNILSSYEFFDNDIYAMNSSNCFYLKKNTEAGVYDLYREKIKINRLNLDIASSMYMLDEYPYLVISYSPTSVICYDLLNESEPALFLNFSPLHTTTDGKVLYNDSGFCSGDFKGYTSVTNKREIITISSNTSTAVMGSIIAITPEYEKEYDAYNYYQLILDAQPDLFWIDIEDLNRYASTNEPIGLNSSSSFLFRKVNANGSVLSQRVSKIYPAGMI